MNIQAFGGFRVSVTGLALLLVLGTTTADAATIEIDCAPTAADDFCGSLDDPCTVEDNLVITAASCAPNFGTRAFVNNGKITVPNGGSLTITAGSITTNAKINGKHTKATEGDGTDVSLIATGLDAASDITINKKINTSGRLTPGSISIDADGDVQLNHQIIARGQGGSAPTATGGTITVHADGTVNSAKRGKIVTRGKKKVTQAGVADISGDLGVNLKGRIEARGLYGGSVAATSATGNVTIEEEIRAYGEFGSGGTVALSAPAGTLTIGGKKGVIKVHGGAPAGGGSATLSAALVVDAQRTINARGVGTNPGGSIDVTGQSVLLRTLRVTGGTGGSINVTSTLTSVGITGAIQAEGRTSDGGNVQVDAADGLTVDGPVFVNASKASGVGGEARFSSGGSSPLTLGVNKNSKFDATGTTGGVIEAQTTATGEVFVAGKFTAPTGGCIGLIDAFDGTPMIEAGSTFNPASQLTTCP